LEELSDRLMEGLSKLEEVADAVTPDDAAKSLDEASLQNFWRDWPELSSWAGALWRRLNEELAEPASPVKDPDLDESGGEG
jgi:hypothetical protein